MIWVGSGTRAAVDYAGMTLVGGSDDATKEGSVSIVFVTGAMVVGIGTYRSGGVGYLVNSLKEAPRLLETGVSTDEL